MGYELRREVRDALPRGLLTAAERLLILEIADNANDESRKAYPGKAKLARLTDLSERSIQEALRRLGEKWIEVRVEIGKDKRGNPVYAYRGHSVDYVFPRDLAEAYRQAQAQRAAALAMKDAMNPGAFKGATDPRAFEEERCDESVERCDRFGERCDESGEKMRQIRTPSPHVSPQSSPHLSPQLDDAARKVTHLERERDEKSPMTKPNSPGYFTAAYEALAVCGVEYAEAEQLIPRIVGGQPKGAGWWRTIANNGDLAGHVADARHLIQAENNKKTAIEAHVVLRREEVRRQRQEQESAAGVVRRPRPRCPTCRTISVADGKCYKCGLAIPPQADEEMAL